MSAAAVPKPVKPIHKICKVPLSYFTEFLSIMNPAQRACFGEVLNLTIGMAAIGKARTWAPIRMDYFAEMARTTQEYASQAVKWLVDSGMIRHRAGNRAYQMEYSISPDLEKETKAEKIQGRCKECKSVGAFSTEFIPAPRSFFTKLAPGLKNAPFLAVAVIMRYSHEHAWSAQDGLQPKWVELDRNDFQRLTDLEERQISTGIKEAIEAGLIEKIERPGRLNKYRTLPENWENLGKKKLRLVIQNQPDKDTEKQTQDKPAEKPLKRTKASAIESSTFRYGYCSKCCRIVEVETLTVADLALMDAIKAENAARKPIQQARAGPPPPVWSDHKSFQAPWKVEKKA